MDLAVINEWRATEAQQRSELALANARQPDAKRLSALQLAILKLACRWRVEDGTDVMISNIKAEVFCWPIRHIVSRRNEETRETEYYDVSYCARRRSEGKRTIGCVNFSAARGRKDDALLTFDRHYCGAGKDKAPDCLRCYQDSSRARSCAGDQEAFRRQVPPKPIRSDSGNVQSTPCSGAIQAPWRDRRI